MERRKLQLNDLPEGILVHILSRLSMWNNKQVVRACILSKQWRHLWKFVPVSLDFNISDSDFAEELADSVASTTRELHYWRFCQNIPSFKVTFYSYEECYAKDVDLWVHFAAKVANVEDFTLVCMDYELPLFVYKNTSIRNLVLAACILKPSGSVSWTGLVSLLIQDLDLTDSVMEKVLPGCPNLERLNLQGCCLHRLEINSLKLRDLIIEESRVENNDLWLEIFAPFIQNLQLLESCHKIRLRNVDSLVTARLYLDLDSEDVEHNLEKELICLKELLHGVAHVQNLELGPWCIQCLSILELKGWHFPPSNRKFLKLEGALVQWDSPGICSFLQSSSDLETLVIHWNKYGSRDLLSSFTNEDEQSRRFETRNVNCSLLYLKTIRFFGSLSNDKFVLPLAKYLLMNAMALEKFSIKTCSGSLGEYVKMKKEFLSFPRSSQHALLI